VPSVSAVVINPRRELLLQFREDNAWWGIPGGSVEIGESVTAAVVREVNEETGLQVEVSRLVGVYSDPANYALASYPGGAVVHHINLCFACRAIGGELSGSEEGLEIGYYPLDNLPQPLLLSHKIRLNDALQEQAEAFIR
jgi:ADP-ribose pyrophosphatase YjhB (NUDIX family)